MKLLPDITEDAELMRVWDRIAIQRKAYKEVRQALKSGALVREPCRACRNPMSHGHHDDYSRPLDVIWLCAKHHVARHRKLGWGAGGARVTHQFAAMKVGDIDGPYPVNDVNRIRARIMLFQQKHGGSFRVKRRRGGAFVICRRVARWRLNHVVAWIYKQS